MARQHRVWNACSRTIAGTLTRRRLSILIGGICVFFALSFCYPNRAQLAQEYSDRLKREISSKVTRAITNTLTDTCTVVNEQITKKRATTGNNWIVVTTINPPTDAMEILCNLEGWNVVVIADTKSPKEWSCGSCVYLGVDEQQCLGFDIVEVTPFKAYTRKNIGYLWAIQQGATTIFDTDDDNLPTSKNIVFESTTGSVIAYRPVNEDSEKGVNVYAHFGRPDIWPRGFPLSEINVRRPVQYLPSFNSLPEYERQIVAPPPLIQQGLADLDPDVDAIFRLTQGHELKKTKFCKMSPSVQLSPGSFCPFNSQNTLFKHDAFWGLVLPISVSFRVCDIWRGYWVQRLLWDVNGSVLFTKPTVDQIRNAHDYLADFKDEQQLYEDSSRFIDFLANWHSDSTTLETRIIDLMKGMAGEKFIGAADVDLTERWIKDLQMIGYVFPKVSTVYNHDTVQKSLEVCQTSPQHLTDSRLLSVDALRECMATTKADPDMAKIQIIKSTDTATVFKDILLVISFERSSFEALEPLLTIYKDHFPNIVFYGPDVPEGLAGKIKSIDHGEYGYKALILAMDEAPNYTGYIFTSSNTVLSPFQLAEMDQNKVWKHVPDLTKDIRDRSKPPPDQENWERGTEALWNDAASFTAAQKERISAFTGVAGPVDIKTHTGGFYIPKRIAGEFKDLLNHFVEHQVFVELAIGLALVAVEPPAQWEDMNERYLWSDPHKWREILKEPGVALVHPVLQTSSFPKTATDIIEIWDWTKVV
ncbi:MAG: hypothetical protein BYD32DRAFT_465177 [Podila humilis]|nr:MAG: hypothetical protein BYD32DRAFT_465177 [Podila humilis]